MISQWVHAGCYSFGYDYKQGGRIKKEVKVKVKKKNEANEEEEKERKVMYLYCSFN